MSPQHTTGTHLLAQLLHSGGERGLVGDVALVDREQHGLLLYSSLFGEHTHTHTHAHTIKERNKRPPENHPQKTQQQQQQLVSAFSPPHTRTGHELLYALERVARGARRVVHHAHHVALLQHAQHRVRAHEALPPDHESVLPLPKICILEERVLEYFGFQKEREEDERSEGCGGR